MKHIALSLLSAVLLSTAIASQSAQAATAPTQSQAAQPSLLSQNPESGRRSPSPLEQRRQDELDRTGEPGGSLNRPRPAAPADVEHAGNVRTSRLHHRRLSHLSER
ncbi:MAG: hypothetical protein WBD47_01885 [Phormidesmis sp.]